MVMVKLPAGLCLFLKKRNKKGFKLNRKNPKIEKNANRITISFKIQPKKLACGILFNFSLKKVFF